MAILAAYAVPHPPLIIPTVGRGEERGIARTIEAYRNVARRIVAHDPETIVVTSPHAPLYGAGFHVTTTETLEGSMARFGAPQTRVSARIDGALVKALEEEAARAGIPLVPSSWRDREMDHATFIPLWFVDEAYAEAGRTPRYEVVRLGIAGLPFEDHRTLGRLVARAIARTGRRAVFVASGDLSHKLTSDGPYGFAPEGPRFDAQIGDLFASGDLARLFAFDPAFCDAAAECGLRSFQIMAGALEGSTFSSELLSLEGPFGVGYGVAAFEVTAENGASRAAEATCDDEPAEGAARGEAACDPYVALARAGVEGFVRTGRPIERPAALPAELTERRAGVFVSLHETGELRGCIGTIAPTTPCIADEIIRNAVSASSEDPRFPPVRPDELDYLEISVDVLAAPEPISDPAELDPARFGVIVTKGWRRGLLLPNLEGVDTVEQQIAIAKRKAGIDPDDDTVSLERFEVVRHTRGGEPRCGAR